VPDVPAPPAAPSPDPSPSPATVASSITLRALDRDADAAEALALDQWAFAYDAGPDSSSGPVLDALPWGRVHGAVRDGGPDLAGLHAAHAFSLGVPGGTVRAAGLTWVGVHPDHRRRGVLTAMMRHHLDEAAARGEPVSLLYAAEPAIYGRFGYGLASRVQRLTLQRRAVLRPVPGVDGVRTSVRAVDAATDADLVGDLHDAAWAGRPGAVPRTTPGLRRVWLHDPPEDRKGYEPLRLMLATDAATGRLRGYALFGRKAHWEDGVPQGTVRVGDLAALDPAARAALWLRLLDVDLMSRVEAPLLPLDDPLVHLLDDYRATVAKLGDGLWLRLVDVPGALAARRYATAVDAVLEVRDDARPGNAGRWRLTGGPDGAACARTTDDPDVALDVRALATTYLGDTSFTALAAAGLAQECRDGAVGALSTAFGWPVVPFCSWVF
jgi:predicted acetyltransferase